MIATPLLLTRFQALPKWSGGTLAVVKWAALALMVLDHVDAFAFHRGLLWGGALGRLVFPAFAVVVGYNLARPGARQSGAYARMMERLVLFGVLAQPFHGALTGAAGGLFPLNVLLTFAVAVGVVSFAERGERALAAILFLVAGGFVEYSWPGVGLVLSVFWLYKVPGIAPALSVVFCTVMLLPFNGSLVAVWALPLLWLLGQLDLTAPRARAVFYWFYPAHLAVFWLAKALAGV